MIASIGSLLKGVAAGAGVMYFLDPDRGRRRRAAVAGKAIHLVHEVEDVWAKGCRDLMNRTTGVAAQARRVVSVTPTDDRVLVARVRAALGHIVADARSLEVSAHNGTITLRGTVRPGEPAILIPAIEKINGVLNVESGLTTAGEPVPVPRRDNDLTPAARMLLTAGGGLLVLNGLARGGVTRTLLGTAGLGLFVRGMTDKPARLFGLDRGHGIDVCKSVRIDAPVEKVYEFISDVEQSGRFLPHVARVETLGGGRVRWTLDGPAGLGRFTCEEQIITAAENERIVWGSTPEAPIRYLGEARFRPEGEGTRLEVRLTYFPPGGVLGHAAASFLGMDPKTQLEGSLNRIRHYFEEGTVPRGGSTESMREHRG
jgi:uncharacterized membrane protein